MAARIDRGDRKFIKKNKQINVMLDREVIKITRITPEQSKQYIPLKNDLTGSPQRYYTLTPSTDPERPASQGWEDVTYYTNRKKQHSIHKGQTNCQWVYILSNPLDPSVHKIGFTKEKPTERLKQINAGTGIYEDLVLEWAFACFNAHDLEKEIHKSLQDRGLRVKNNKEFFYISLQEAKQVIQSIGHPYRMVDNE